MPTDAAVQPPALAAARAQGPQEAGDASARRRHTLARKLLLAGCILGAMWMLVLAAVWLLVDVKTLKPQLEQASATRLKRSLQIDGDVRLSLFPRIAIELPAGILSDRDSTQDFARFRAARVSLAVLPLFVGRVEPVQLLFASVSATLQRYEDGSTNVDDLLGRTVDTATRMPPAGIALEATAIELEGAKLDFVDSGKTVLTLSSLNLSASALAPGLGRTLKFSSAYKAPGDEGRGVLALVCALAVDADSGAIGLRELQTRVQGVGAGNPFDLKLSVANFSFGDTIAGDGVAVELWPTGKRELHVSLDIDGFGGTREGFSVRTVRGAVGFDRGPRVFAAHWSSAVQGSLDAATVQLSGIEAAVTMNDPARTEGVLELALAGHGTLNARLKSAQFMLQGDHQGAPVKLVIELSGVERPEIRLDLDGARRDIVRDLLESAPVNGASGSPPGEG